jgi:alpha-galactosidase
MTTYPITSILLLTLLYPTLALDNGAALLPPLIVSTEALGCDINEVNIRQLIDQIIGMGLEKIGFRYVLIADCWQVRDW